MKIFFPLPLFLLCYCPRLFFQINACIRPWFGKIIRSLYWKKKERGRGRKKYRLHKIHLQTTNICWKRSNQSINFSGNVIFFFHFLFDIFPPILPSKPPLFSLVLSIFQKLCWLFLQNNLDLIAFIYKNPLAFAFRVKVKENDDVIYISKTETRLGCLNRAGVQRN